jgi:hypothetical protein
VPSIENLFSPPGPIVRRLGLRAIGEPQGRTVRAKLSSEFRWWPSERFETLPQRFAWCGFGRLRLGACRNQSQHYDQAGAGRNHDLNSIERLEYRNVLSLPASRSPAKLPFWRTDGRALREATRRLPSTHRPMDFWRRVARKTKVVGTRRVPTTLDVEPSTRKPSDADARVKMRRLQRQTE